VSTPLLSAKESPQRETTTEIVRVAYTHDAMIDFLVANPHADGRLLSLHFGYTQGWISCIIQSDAFRERLAQRKDELVDPAILAELETKFRALADLSLTKMLEKLESPNVTFDDAAKGAEIAAKALGYGAKVSDSRPNVVVMLPAQAGSSAEWSAKHAPIDITPTEG
jgi:hypothetical protein